MRKTTAIIAMLLLVTVAAFCQTYENQTSFATKNKRSVSYHGYKNTTTFNAKPDTINFGVVHYTYDFTYDSSARVSKYYALINNSQHKDGTYFGYGIESHLSEFKFKKLEIFGDSTKAFSQLITDAIIGASVNEAFNGKPAGTKKVFIGRNEYYITIKPVR